MGYAFPQIYTISLYPLKDSQSLFTISNVCLHVIYTMFFRKIFSFWAINGKSNAATLLYIYTMYISTYMSEYIITIAMTYFPIEREYIPHI